jgi:hypothetical protein
MNKEKLINAFFEKEINLIKYVVVANTWKNVSHNRLQKLLSNLTHRINHKLVGRNFKKKINAHKRIGFYCFPQVVKDNRHSHILIKKPPTVSLNRLLTLLKEVWTKIMNKGQMWIEKLNNNKKDEYRNIYYSARKFKTDDMQTFFPL